jgi:hypothetical protein
MGEQDRKRNREKDREGDRKGGNVEIERVRKKRER